MSGEDGTPDERRSDVKQAEQRSVVPAAPGAIRGGMPTYLVTLGVSFVAVTVIGGGFVGFLDRTLTATALWAVAGGACLILGLLLTVRSRPEENAVPRYPFDARAPLVPLGLLAGLGALVAGIAILVEAPSVVQSALVLLTAVLAVIFLPWGWAFLERLSPKQRAREGGSVRPSLVIALLVVLLGAAGSLVGLLRVLGTIG